MLMPAEQRQSEIHLLMHASALEMPILMRCRIFSSRCDASDQGSLIAKCTRRTARILATRHIGQWLAIVSTKKEKLPFRHNRHVRGWRREKSHDETKKPVEEAGHSIAADLRPEAYLVDGDKNCPDKQGHDWRSLGDSNPCFRRERATSWTARRRERSAFGAGAFYSGVAARLQAFPHPMPHGGGCAPMTRGLPSLSMRPI